MPTTRSTERSGTTALRRIPRREPALQPSDVLSKGAQTLHGQRARAELACQVVTREVGLADPHSTRIAVREHDEEPDVTVPTVRPLGSDGLPDQGVAPVRQANLCRERRLNVLQSVVHSKEDFGMNHAPVQNFFGNWVWWLASALSHNIARWMRVLALPESFATCRGKRLRTSFVNIAARVVRRSRRLVLRLPAAYRYAEAFIAALERLRRLPRFA